MPEVLGTTGYSGVIQHYIDAVDDIPFDVLHKAFLKYIPDISNLVLDIGAGFGRDAHQLSLSGHHVIAVEPSDKFRDAGMKRYRESHITWVNDSLPALDGLKKYNSQFDFILCSNVWHHLDQYEQYKAMQRVAQLLKPNGIFALSLRNGPAGPGCSVFPIDISDTIAHAKECNFQVLRKWINQPSLIMSKSKVKWSRLVLKRKSDRK